MSIATYGSLKKKILDAIKSFDTPTLENNYQEIAPMLGNNPDYDFLLAAIENKNKEAIDFFLTKTHRVSGSCVEACVINNDIETLRKIAPISVTTGFGLSRALSMGNIIMIDALLEYEPQLIDYFWISAAKNTDSLMYLWRKGCPTNDYTLGNVIVNGGLIALTHILCRIPDFPVTKKSIEIAKMLIIQYRLKEGEILFNVLDKALKKLE